MIRRELGRGLPVEPAPRASEHCEREAGPPDLEDLRRMFENLSGLPLRGRHHAMPGQGVLRRKSSILPKKKRTWSYQRGVRLET